jgi:N-formylglutamate deformylase
LTLPILISIPHGGMDMPPELKENTCITKFDLFDDIDPFVREIFDIGTKAKKIISTNIARTFVDLNRSMQDLPPKNPDGLIKSMTCYEKPIYHSKKHPDEKTTSILIEKYYKTYHREIQKALKEFDFQLCLDCHSMASEAPSISPDGNSKPRPLFCISNQNGKTCSDEMLHLLGESLKKSFSLQEADLKFNDPFQGGYITKTYGNNPVPWIQIEMNRSLYLSEQWFDRQTLTINKKRLSELNKMFNEALSDLFDKFN